MSTASVEGITDRLASAGAAHRDPMRPGTRNREDRGRSPTSEPNLPPASSNGSCGNRIWCGCSADYPPQAPGRRHFPSVAVLVGENSCGGGVWAVLQSHPQFAVVLAKKKLGWATRPIVFFTIDHLFARMQRLNTYEATTNTMTTIGSNLSQVLPPPFRCE